MTGIAEGLLGEGRGLHYQRGPPMVWGVVGTGKDFWGLRGSKGKGASIFLFAQVPSARQPFLATQVLSLSPALPRAFTGRVDPGPKPSAQASSGHKGLGPEPPLNLRTIKAFSIFFFSCWCTVLLHCFYIFVFYDIFFYFSKSIFLFIPVWCPFLWHAVQLARSWFPGWGLDWSSCGGSTESKPLD